jgi:gliding motility-associated-like protein
MEEYLWNTGATTQKIVVSKVGTYRVTVRNKNGCIISDSIQIKEDPNALPSDLFMPNAFTPNGDNINDVYPGNKYSDPGADYQLRLYNRWGEQIFESNTPSVTWDGKIKGDLAPQDVYVFYTQYVGCDNIERWFRGTFHLIR